MALDYWTIDIAEYDANFLFRYSSAAPLARAAEAGDTQTIDSLIARGIDIDSRGRGDATPLSCAYFKRSTAGYVHLLNRGASPNIPDNSGFTITHMVADDADSGWLREAIIHGANVNAVASGRRGYYNYTPIFPAIWKERNENVRLLIQAGADLNFEMEPGRRPLGEAINTTNFEMVYDLIVGGANFQYVRKDGKPIIIVIASDIKNGPEDFFDPSQKQWHTKVIELLEAKGVDFSPFRTQTDDNS